MGDEQPLSFHFDTIRKRHIFGQRFLFLPAAFCDGEVIDTFHQDGFTVYRGRFGPDLFGVKTI